MTGLPRAVPVDQADRGGPGVAGAVVAGAFDAVGVVAGRLTTLG